ncbi:MAG: hypothetical protein ACRDP7_23855 [Trebonia sp.]
MTARPAFGDFVTAARGHVSAAVAGHQADRSGEHVQEVADSLLHVITVMDRYLQSTGRSSPSAIDVAAATARATSDASIFASSSHPNRRPVVRLSQAPHHLPKVRVGVAELRESEALVVLPRACKSTR